MPRLADLAQRRMLEEYAQASNYGNPRPDTQLASLIDRGGNFIRNDQTGNVTELGPSSPEPTRFAGSPVDVFGQGRGYLDPYTGLIQGTNRQGQQFRVQPEGTQALMNKERADAEMRDLNRQKMQLQFEALKAKQNQPAKKPNLSSSAQKELFEATDTVEASKNVLGLLDEAEKLNDTAYSGYGATERAAIRSNIPFIGESEEANATINLDNIMTSQALANLKAVFGGMPTEGERKILLDIQASPSKTPQQRKDIIARARQAAQQRMAFNAEKARQLRSGEFFGESSPATEQSDIDAILNKYQ